MKRQRSSNAEGDQLDDEDEWDEFKPLFDYVGTLGSAPAPAPAPTLLSDDSDIDDLVITSGPAQRRPKVSPAKEPPASMPQKDPAPRVILEDDGCESWMIPAPAKLPQKDPAPRVILEDDSNESWMIPAPAKLPSTLPELGYQPLQARRSRRKELMMLQESSTPEAITRYEDPARMQAQKRPEVVQSPLELNTPNRSNVHGKSPVNEADEETILIIVQNKDGDIQPIRIFMTETFERLFKVYAEAFNIPLAYLSFVYDGEILAPYSTPKYHTMEDGEFIEVYSKI